MDALVRHAILLSVLGLTLSGVGVGPSIIDPTAPVLAAQPGCVTLPGAVPPTAGARSRNPQVCPPPAPVTEYTLRTTDAQTADPEWKTSYSANDTYALYFALDVSGEVTGEHSYNLFIFAPGGLPYQAFAVTYTATSCAPDFACSVEQTSDGIRIWTSIPVAGTFIQQFQIYGTWTADAYIDGAGPDATTSFDIVP